jgi:hypothetical protein
MATERSMTPSGRRLRVGVLLALALPTVAAVVTCSGPAEGKAPVPFGFGSRVVSITLPYEEPDLPPGPHLREFQIACTSCHSTRLALLQPAFPKAKWEAEVKKMVDAFGAPLTREDQAHAVEYLTAVRGK